MIRLASRPSVDFIDNRMTDVGANLADRYNHTLEMYIPRRALTSIVRPDDVMQRQEDMFMKALQKYEQSGNGKSVVTFTKDDFTSWDDVLRHANAAAENYRQAGTKKRGFKGELRGLVRKLEDAKDYVEPWMRLLPSQSWQGSLVCGGISTILEAAGRLQAIRDDTYEIFEEIPASIEMAYAWVQLNFNSERSEKLEECVSHLFLEILKFLEATLDWYATNPVKKGWKAVISGDSYGKTLAHARDRMRSIQFMVKDEVSLSNDLRLRRVERNIGRVETNQEIQTVIIVNEFRRLLNEQEHRKGNAVELILLKREEERAHYERDRAEWLEERQRNEERLEQEHRVAQESLKKERRFRIKDQKDHLLETLDYQQDLPLLDLKECLVLGPTLLRHAQNRAVWVLGSKEIGLWLSSSRSCVLIINGNEGCHEKHSAVSFFSAMMLQVLLTEERGNIALFWFFGEHLNKPINMAIRSLLSQLVDQSHQDVPPPELDQDDDLDDFDDLLENFVELLEQQLKLSPVFLALDSITFSECGRYKEELHSLIDAIAGVAQEDGGRPHILKVLMTSPTRCRYRPDKRLKDSPFRVLEVPEVVNQDVRSFNQLDFTEHIKSITGGYGK